MHDENDTDEAEFQKFIRLAPQEREKRYIRLSEVKRYEISDRAVRGYFYAGEVTGFYVANRLWIEIESLVRYLSKVDKKRKGID